MTKWATTIYNADTIPEIVRKAIRIARSEKPGAVHIELPEDITKHDVDETPMTPRRFRRPVADDEIVDRAFELIAQARNPVILVWEDNEYGPIAWKQESQFGKHTDLSFGNPDWMQLASAFGWHGHMINRSSDFATVLESSFAESGPSLVVVPVDYRENMLLNERLGELNQPSPIAG